MGRGIRNRVRGSALKRVTANPINDWVSESPKFAQIGDGGPVKEVSDPLVFQHTTASDVHETNVGIPYLPKNPIINARPFENKLHWTQKDKETHDNSSKEMEKVRSGNGTDQEGNFEINIKNVKDAKDENVEIESMSFSHGQEQEEMPRTQLAESSKKKRKNASFGEVSEAIKEAAHILAVEIKDSFTRLSGAISQEITEKQKGLNGELMRTTALTMMERHKATRLITHDNASVNIFFSLPDEEKEEWVRALLSGSI